MTDARRGSGRSGGDGSASRVVHDEVRRLIVTGGLEAGATLSQVQLAEALGVSRTPLREALRMLQREGLIEAEANRMVRVASFSIDDLEEVYGLRILNEAFAIRISVPLMSQEDDAFLDAKLGDMERLMGDFEAWEEHHRLFHRRLVRNAGPRTVRLLDELADHSERYRRMFSGDPRAWTSAAAEHVAIVEAVHARDAKLAADQLVRHLSHTAVGVLMQLAPEHEPATIRTALRIVMASGGGAAVLSPFGRSARS
jgi:DNA-binding GntR family transcriptional regulator